jgi:nucleotide-binding universal stress UspA family protein
MGVNCTAYTYTENIGIIKMIVDRIYTKPQLESRSGNTSSEFERILFLTDLSPESIQALPYAATLSKRLSVKLSIGYCSKDSSYGISKNLKEMLMELVYQGTDLTDIETLDWDEIIIEGDTPEAILYGAGARKSDLLVMNSRRKPYRAALLGSMAESICRSAPCPVFLTHSDEWGN